MIRLVLLFLSFYFTFLHISPLVSSFDLPQFPLLNNLSYYAFHPFLCSFELQTSFSVKEARVDELLQEELDIS